MLRLANGPPPFLVLLVRIISLRTRHSSHSSSFPSQDTATELGKAPLIALQRLLLRKPLCSHPKFSHQRGRERSNNVGKKRLISTCQTSHQALPKGVIGCEIERKERKEKKRSSDQLQGIIVTGKKSKEAPGKRILRTLVYRVSSEMEYRH